MGLGTEIALIKALGGGSGGGLPEVTSADAGKVLGVNDSGVWGAQEPIGKKFIVTLTPTALDLSGTADKTLNEVNSAYEAGNEIVAHITYNDVEIEAKLVQVIQGAGFFPTFYWMLIDPTQNMQVMAFNAATADDPNPTPFNYSTYIYALTPAT